MSQSGYFTEMDHNVKTVIVLNMKPISSQSAMSRQFHAKSQT